MEYYLDPTTRFPQEVTRCPGMNPVLAILEEVFDPTGTHLSAFKDCVLVSLDIEYQPDTHRINQIGLASLDTRDICTADDMESANNILSSRLLLLQKQRSDRGAYLFGDPENHFGENIKSLLLAALTISDTKTTKPRNVILVGHSVRCDIRAIQRSCGFNLLTVPTIKAIVDTSPIVNRIFNTSRRYHSLRDMCKLLGMYKRNIHTAGNDAMYTLKALLLMFCHYKEEKLFWNFSNGPTDPKVPYKSQLEAIGRIARCNNGIGRFVKQRTRKQNSWSKQNNDTRHNHDMLDDDAAEDGVMSGLFTM